jgi:hypothetical protein
MNISFIFLRLFVDNSSQRSPSEADALMYGADSLLYIALSFDRNV